MAALAGRLEGDGVAECLEVVDEAAALAIRVASGSEVVLAQVVVALAGGEDISDGDQKAVGDGDGRLVGPATPGDLAVLGAVVAVLGTGCGPGGFN